MTVRGALVRFVGFLTGDGVPFVLNMVLFAWLFHVLSPRAYGEYAVAYSIANWVFPLVLQGMSLAGPLLMSGQHPGPALRVILKVRLAGGLLACGIAGTAAAFAPTWDSAILMLAYCPVFLLLSLNGDFLSIVTGRPWLMARSRLVASALYLALVLLFVRGSTPLFWLPLGQGLGMLAGSILQHWELGRIGIYQGLLRGPAPFGPLQVLRKSIATTGGHFLQMGYYTTDVILLGVFFKQDLALVGQYAAASRLLQTAILPMSSLLYAVSGHYVAGARGDWDELALAERLFKRGCLFVGFVGAVGYGLLARPGLEWLNQEALRLSTTVFVVFAALYMVVGIHSPFTAVFPFLGGYGAYLATNGAAFVVAVAANAILIPLWGIEGAAIGTLLAVGSLVPSGWWAYRRQKRLIFPNRGA